MKEIIFPIAIAILLIFVASACDRQTTPPVEGMYYIQKTDTVIKRTVLDSIVIYNDDLIKKLDSLNNINSVLSEDNFILNYKLERIRYYNDIAKNGNNIKFLRGWIKRVLDNE